MKKSVCLVIIIQLVFTACSNNSLDSSNEFDVFLKELDKSGLNLNACTSVNDAFIFPENWSREDLDSYENLPDDFFGSMSTCGLLKTLLEHPTNSIAGPWCMYCNNSELPGVTMFNNRLSMNKAAVELFKRDECVSVLASKYLTVIKQKEETDRTEYFEILLSSDMCMKTLKEREKILFMAMALERVKNKSESIRTKEPLHIIVAILKSCNYTPFLNEFGTEWTEGTWGYGICNVYENEIIEYAKQFLNEKK